MIPLEVIFDTVHSKEFYVNGKTVECFYDFEYCKSIENPNLRTIEDGYYTYIIHDNHQLKISKVRPFENGSKHIQLIQGTAIPYVGGEFKKSGDVITYNLYAGLFRHTNPYNETHYKRELKDMIHKTFRKCNVSVLNFVNHELIIDSEFINNGIWKPEHLKQQYHIVKDTRNE